MIRASRPNYLVSDRRERCRRRAADLIFLAAFAPLQYTAAEQSAPAVCEGGVHGEPSRRAPERSGDATREGVADNYQPGKNKGGVAKRAEACRNE